jgi:hypothetical protein
MDKDGSGLADVHELMLENGGRAEFAVKAENRSVQVTLLQPRQSSPGRSRVARRVSATELCITNLLPFSVIPQTIFTLPLRDKPLIPTASLNLAFCLAPLSVRKIGPVIAPLHPRNQLQYVVNRRYPQR